MAAKKERTLEQKIRRALSPFNDYTIFFTNEEGKTVKMGSFAYIESKVKKDS